MIAVDTSALMAIILEESRAEDCRQALLDEDVVISAATVTEALVVAGRRNAGAAMEALLSEFGIVVVPVTAASARAAAEAYRQWGKGVHPAALNLCDCFAYEVAKAHACPLLFVGDDFSQTDIEAAL